MFSAKGSVDLLMTKLMFIITLTFMFIINTFS